MKNQNQNKVRAAQEQAGILQHEVSVFDAKITAIKYKLGLVYTINPVGYETKAKVELARVVVEKTKMVVQLSKAKVKIAEAEAYVAEAEAHVAEAHLKQSTSKE